MKILLNQKQIDEVPNVHWRDKDRILSYLWGIHYTEDGAEPIYRSILRAWRTPGMLYIEIPGYLFIFMRRFPYFYKEKSKGLEIR